MSSKTLSKAGLLMLLIVTVSLISWEKYVRSKGFDKCYDEGPPLWSDKMDKVNDDTAKTVVFIGSSRIKFDLDINTWNKTTGCQAIQLACVGTNPIPTLEALAADEKFHGKLVVDVTEELFFSVPDSTESPLENLKYYKHRSPAQWMGFQLDHLLESQFVFLDKDNLSLNSILESWRIPSRKDVFVLPLFPTDFGRDNFARQSYMTPSFLKDTSHVNRVKAIWALYASFGAHEPPLSVKTMDSLFNLVKQSVDKIKARGGTVLFTRTPSCGPMLTGELAAFPREKYWDKLLTTTKCSGIYFSDYPSMANFVCPEFSHLSQPDAVLYTKALIKILASEKGWKFPNAVQL